MRRFALAAVCSVTLAGPLAAQTPAPQTPPPQTPPAKPVPAQPAPEPPRPFPQGAKIAFVNIQRIANESSEGKAATSKLDVLRSKKAKELDDKNKALATAQQKLQQQGTVLSETARAQLEKEIDRMQVDIQRFTQDAQAEVQDLQQDLQVEFQRKLMPIINQVANEKDLHMVLSQADAGIVWADVGLDITADVIKKFDTPGAAAPKPEAQKPPEG